MSKKILTTEQLADMLSKASSPEDYKALAEAAIAANTAQANELSSATEFNADLQRQLLESAKGSKSFQSFKAGKDTYLVLHGVSLDGVTLTPQQISESAEVQKKLIKAESSAISLQVKDE